MNIAPKHLLPHRHQQDAAVGLDTRQTRSAAGPVWSPVIIRRATADDRFSLEHLAALDSAEVPVGAILIGVLRERPVVAVSLTDGKAIANPFVATAEILELVRLRAEQLDLRSRARERPRVISRSWRKARFGLAALSRV
jgi:hypothetical protein